jgi:hypothetical protein
MLVSKTFNCLLYVSVPVEGQCCTKIYGSIFGVCAISGGSAYCLGSLSGRSEILSFPWEYIFSLMNFVPNNQEKFETSSSVHSINPRNKHKFTELPTFNISGKAHSMLAPKSQQFAIQTQKTDKKKQHDVVLRYIHVHSF